MSEGQCYAHAHERIHAETAIRGTHRGRTFRIICTVNENAEPIWLVFGVEGLGLLRFDAGWPLAAVENEVWRRIDALTPDPAHTPAVRRVVVWETGPWRFDDIDDAYCHAARDIIGRAWVRHTHVHEHSSDEWWELWPEERVAKVAQWLRHRDEKAGHR